MVKIKRRQTGVFLLQKLCVLLDATQRWGRWKQKNQGKNLGLFGRNEWTRRPRGARFAKQTLRRPPLMTRMTLVDIRFAMCRVTTLMQLFSCVLPDATQRWGTLYLRNARYKD